MQTNNLSVLVRLTKFYSLVVLLTVVLLVVFSIMAPHLATKDAWVHAVIVAAFAVILPFRARAAQDGKHSALRATGIISSVLFLVNVIEGVLPNFMPTWMRIDVFVVAALMACIIGLVIKISLRKNESTS